MDSVESVQRISADGESDLDGQSDDSGPFWDGKDTDKLVEGVYRGRIAQWIAFLLLTQLPRVRFSEFPSFSEMLPRFFDGALPRESGQCKA